MLRFWLGLYSVLCTVLLSIAVQAIPFAPLSVEFSTPDHVLDHAEHRISSRTLDARIFNPKNILAKAQKDAKKLTKQVQNTVNTLGQDLQSGSSAVKAASENVLEAFVEATDKGTKNADKMLSGTAAQLEKLGEKMNPDKLVSFVARFSSAAQQFIESLPTNNVNWLGASSALLEYFQKASKKDQEAFSTFVSVVPAEVSDQVLSEDNVNQQSGSSSQSFGTRFTTVLTDYEQTFSAMQSATTKIGTQSAQVVSDAKNYLTDGGTITATQRDQLLKDYDAVAENMVAYVDDVKTLMNKLRQAKLASGTMPDFTVGTRLDEDAQARLNQAASIANSLRAWKMGGQEVNQQSAADGIRDILGLPPAEPVPTIEEEELDTKHPDTARTGRPRDFLGLYAGRDQQKGVPGPH